MKHSNLIVQEVIERFDTVYKFTKVFVTGNSAQKFIIISGDAGTGKSHFVQKAFADTETHRIDYHKSKSFSAAAFYVTLYLNREPGNVVVFDDCWLERASGGHFKIINGFAEDSMKKLREDARKKKEMEDGYSGEFDRRDRNM